MEELIEEMDEERLLRLYTEPSFFVEQIIGVTPYDYQSKFLDTEERFRCFVSGRQVGKSRAVAWLALHRFATRQNHNVFMFSPTERQAVELFHKTVKAEIEESDLDIDEEWGVTHETKTMIEGTNGSRIVSMPAAGDGSTIRGFTAHTIIVDEAAFIEEEFFKEVLGPMLMTTDGEWVLTSTPYGARGFLYDKFHDENWFSQQVSSYDNPNADPDFIDNELADGMSKMQYKQEILGQFEPAQDAFFDPETIKRNVALDEVDGVGSRCYMGVDPARFGKDYSAFVCVDNMGQVFHIESTNQKPLTDAMGRVRRLNSIYGFERIYVDENALGGGLLDDLQEDLRNVEGFKFSRTSRPAVYQHLKKMLEDDELTLPDHRRLKRELLEMQHRITSAGNLQVHHPDDGHDDHADALALALAAWHDNAPKERTTQAYDFADYRRSGSREGRQAYSFDL